MAGRLAGKPYAKAAEATSIIRAFITELPPQCVKALLPFLKASTQEDDLQEYITLYYEEAAMGNKGIITRTQERIKAHIAAQNREITHLYNPYRNISLNQCFGESKTPVLEWLDLSGWQEWGE